MRPRALSVATCSTTALSRLGSSRELWCQQCTDIYLISYVISFVAFGAPIVLAGQLAGTIGLVPTVLWYSAVAVLLALVSVGAQLLLERGTREVAGLARLSAP